MTPQEIIARAWTITKKERGLRRWGYASAFFETMRSLELLAYQAYYLYWYFQGVTVGWLSVEVLFFENLPFWIFVTITTFLIILIFFQLFIPTLSAGAIIGLGAKSHKNEEVKGGLVLALSNFLPILEIHGLFLLSNFVAAITAFSLLLRYGGEGPFRMTAMIFLGFIIFISTLFRFFASFSEEGVVITREGVFTCIGRSFKLIISHIGHVVFLGILLVVISLRIVINAIMLLLFPALMMGLGLLLTTFLSATLSYIITGIIGLILLLILSYFFAYLHVFKQTVWTITFLELSKQKEMDVIDVE